MPIINDKEVDMRMVHLGFGDIAICTSRYEGNKCDNVLDFFQQPYHPVGSIASQEEMESLTKEFKGFAPVRIAFENVQSLDVLLERLGAIRAEMVAIVGEPQNETPNQ
jgi:hypothetical protein